MFFPVRLVSRRLAATPAFAILLVGLAALACHRPDSSRPAQEANATAAGATAQRKDFVSTLRVHGTVEAVSSWVVAAPRLAGSPGNSLVVTRLAAPGSYVQKGDLLVEFDRQGQIKAAQDRRSDYLDLVAQIQRKQAEQDIARARDDTELKQAEHDVERARLEILKNEMLSRIAAEKNEQALQEAEATLDQLRRTFDLKRRAARADLRTLEIQRDRALAAARHAEGNATKMAITAPLDGLVVRKTTWKGSGMGEVQEGEEVRPGVPILEVVSRAGMQVRARVNQADGHGLRPGMNATIRLDAYPGFALPGRLERLTPVAGASDLSPRVRFFVAIFSVTGSDPRLMPDLSSGVDVELARVDRAVVVPRGALALAGGRWFVTAEGGRRMEVELGPMNDVEAVVRSGLDEGARIAPQPLPQGGTS
ncbi:MAG TPA: HlyD family efflux transporter periplasmic adaptor subunit [Vicinamibacterales bacterium]|nr:HlyD family efflux transporter periplasmic adaptor subunit [Vicinamibacterales bacterium]